MSSRWLKAVPGPEQQSTSGTQNVSMSDVRRIALEKAAAREAQEAREQELSSLASLPTVPPEPDSGQPDNQPPVDQTTTLVNQLTSESYPTSTPAMVNQSTSQPVTYAREQRFPSRIQRKLKGARLPINKIDRYELWCLLNRVDYQDAVEFALDWLTSQPINQLTGQPANQLTPLINNDLNNELVINDEKAKRVFAKYSELTGKPISKKDQEAYGEVAHLDIAVILGGLETAIKRAGAAGSRVNSFRYANNCILEIAKLGAQVTAAAATDQPPRDYSQCPDCSGSGFYYPEGIERGVARCTHAALGKMQPPAAGQKGGAT